MICEACGYDDSGYALNEKEFIPTELKLSVEKDGNYGKIIQTYTVYICPNCGTLKVYL